MLDEELEHFFKDDDIPRTFDLLEEYFSVSKVWRSKYSQYKNRYRHRHELEIFAQFLIENLEPQIKHLTQRTDIVVISLMKYVIRMKVNRGQPG